ncbi:hypothetical protein HHI36_002747 [Cryptolaemus montrouzieri]|uniref:ascorbate ferrireductase (transmembrane) n=1 Tax=Cryptolaemus montrouzieri TaxID=559131 RepID=A0ABD2PBH7_9CUCU
MAEEKMKAKDKRKRKEQSELSKDTHKIVQLFEFVFTFLIIVLIFISVRDEGFRILNGHVFQSTMGWMVMMVQGLLVFNGVNPLFKKIMGKDQIFIHWVIETIALIGASLGFYCAYEHKVENNKEHFTTWHAWLGLIGYVLCIVTGLNGIPTLYRKELKNWISPSWNKQFHFVTGTIGFGCGGVSLILACYSKWFARRTSNSFVTFCIAVFLVASVFVWSIIKPINKIRGNWRKMNSKD